MKDIKPLLVFAVVLENGSMNAAAKVLRMTPSAVSQHISKLENLHGVKLLNRSTRRLVATDAGRTLGLYCERLRHVLNDTQMALNNLKVEAAGELKIALTSGVIDTPMFQTTLKRLQHEYPYIHPNLLVNDDLLDLQQSDVDIAIRGGDHALDDPNLIARHLVSWSWKICAAPNYLAKFSPITQPEQLHQHKWLHFLPVSITLHHGIESYQLAIKESIGCSQIAAVRSLTLGGVGLSLQLEGEVREQIEKGSLRIILPDWALPTVNLYAVTAYRVQSAKVEAAIGILQESFSV